VEPKEQTTAYVPWVGGDLNEILCHQEERVVQNDNTVSYNTLRLQIPKDDLRHHYVKTTVQVRHYLDGSLGLFFGNRCLGRFDAMGHIQEAAQSLQKVA